MTQRTLSHVSDLVKSIIFFFFALNAVLLVYLLLQSNQVMFEYGK